MRTTLPPASVYGPGDVIGGDYRVVDVKGGGLGRVYVCEQLDARYDRGDALCALKTPRVDRLTDADTLDRFRAEAANWVSVPPHPNIVLAYGVENHGRLPYIVMEYVRGVTLSDALAAGRVDWLQILHVALGMARGLAHAQRTAQLSHGDLKPDNVMLTSEGAAKVTDFGLSVSRRTGTGVHEGYLGGTEGFIAPEMYDGLTVPTEASDIYAFGVTLALALRHAADVPIELAALADACMQRDPATRPGHFHLIAQQLERLCFRRTGVEAEADVPPDLPTPAQTWRNAAQAWLNIGDWNLAEDAARRAIAADDSAWTAHNALGLVRLEAGDFAEALRHFDDAHRCDRDAIVPIVNAALACRGAGDGGGAERWLQRAVTWCTDHDQIARLDAVSSLIVETWEPEAALGVCDRIVSGNPQAVSTWNNRAILLRRMGRPADALESADRAVRINPTYAKAWVNRANALVQLRRFDEAIASADTALELEPTLVTPILAKATALAQTGRMSAARAVVENGLAGNPRDAQLLKARRVFNTE